MNKSDNSLLDKENTKKLKDELEQTDLDTNKKNTLLNIFENWKNSELRHIIIENNNNKNIYTSSFVNLNSKTTLYITNCNNIEINIEHKINHIIIEKCNNVSVNIFGGIISGIDIFRSKQISVNIDKKQIFSIVYYICKYCTLKLHESISDIIIATENSDSIIFELVTQLHTKKYITNKSIFSPLTYFTFLTNDRGSYLLYKNYESSGVVCEEN